MKGFIGLTKRNLLVFFKDKQSVVFSLLTSIIVLALYLFFIKGTFVDSINSALEGYGNLASCVSEDDVKMFANLFLLTGILGSAMITVPYNCLITAVRDKEHKIDFDILATPIKRGRIILSYFTAAALSSIILNTVILTAGLVVMSFFGDLNLSLGDVAAAYGIVMLGSVSATAVFIIPILFIKNSGASGAFFGMLSAAAGFVIGAYIPISQFSKGVQTVCNIFPASQITIILRNILLNGTLEKMDSSIGGLDGGMFTESLRNIFTFKANVFDKSLGVPQMLLYILCGIIICMIIQVLIYGKTYKKK